MHRHVLIVLCVLFTIRILSAQESDHNRLAVQEQLPWQISGGTELSLLPVLQGDRETILLLQPSVEMLVQNRYYASLSFPIYLRLPLSVSDLVPFTIAPGDLNLTASWIGHTNRGQHRIGISWTIPIGISSLEAAENDTIQTGGLLHQLDLSWQYTRYTDPVSLDLGIRLGTSIPGTLHETFYWEPLSVGLTTGATILMNRWIALVGSLSQSLSLPPRLGNQWGTDTLLYQARLGSGLWYTDRRHSFGMELSRDMANPLERLGISVRYFYIIKPKQSH